MYTSTFTFAKKQFDSEFQALDDAIAAAARALPGYLGEEAWENPSTGAVSTVYYWDRLEALQALMQLPDHQVAKQRQGRWLDGYHVVVAQVIGSYGDGGLPHPLRDVKMPLAASALQR